MRGINVPGTWAVAVLAAVLLVVVSGVQAATTQKHYYAHDAVEDQYGVIAPWYKGLNGQCDYRVRIAAETLKRYPWAGLDRALAEYPHYIWNGHWSITSEGVITAPDFSDWDNGDMGQRSSYVLSSLADYYRYTGDPAAIAHLTWQSDFLVTYCQTGADNPWPHFLISVPNKGKPYGLPNPDGMIQLDIAAEMGIGLLKSYEVTGEPRYLNAAKHWGDLFALHCDLTPGAEPWPRYANPGSALWPDNKQTGGVSFVLYFLDELIRLGYTGTDNAIVTARDAGRLYLRDKLLPLWTVNDTWGLNYWDGKDNMQAENVTEFTARYMIDNKGYFPNWRSDVRNIMSLFLNHTSVNPPAMSEVYSGAWAYPESCGCCGRSLWYGPMEIAWSYAQYGVEADSEWGRELARRQQMLATYDIHDTGVSEDNIDGGQIVNGGWFKIAHPMALKHVLQTIAWLPEALGANRENHIVRSTATVNSVVYGKGRVDYSTFDAPTNTIDVLRLAFTPTSVKADGAALVIRGDLNANGYTTNVLSNGDCIVSIRHDGAKSVVVEGDDPQQVADDAALEYTGTWNTASDSHDYNGGIHSTITTGACPTPYGEAGFPSTASFTFTGNQVRLIGRADAYGGLADVYVDGVKQLVGIDCWNPSLRYQQTLYYKNGLEQGQHTLKIVARGEANPRSGGTGVYIDAVMWSDATGDAGFGSGGGPTDTQRMIFGYPVREDYTDSQGNKWRPGTEFIVRAAHPDSVVQAWWTDPVEETIVVGADEELYRYGVHGPELIVNVTVGPGTYHARLKFAATRGIDTGANCITVLVNGRAVASMMDVSATAGGPNRAVDLVVNDIAPRNGAIEIRLTGGDLANGIKGEAFIQAIEVGPGDGGQGAKPISAGANQLANPGFEDGVMESSGPDGGGLGWRYSFRGSSTGHICAESGVGSARPAWGASEYHEGGQALRTYGDNIGHTVVYQDVEASPNSNYRASAWVRARDLDGQGFGYCSSDSAGIEISEYDANGSLILRHPKSVATEPGPYAQVSCVFTTQPNTAEVRFSLDTAISCDKTHGSVTYDDCALYGPAAPCTVTGRVTCRGAAVENAAVSVGGLSGTTDVNGVYSFTDVVGVGRLCLIEVDKAELSRADRRVRLGPCVNTVDFELVGDPADNLLTNPGFESGAADWETSPTGGFGWTYVNSGGNVWNEGIYADYTQYGVPEFHSGAQACRTMGYGASIAHVQMYQDVDVRSGSSYEASAWLRCRALSDAGFGSGSSDSGGIIIQELAADGSLVTEHSKAEILSAGPYVRTGLPFTTSATTAKVRYALDTVIASSYASGSITYDDCALSEVSLSAGLNSK